MAPAYTPSTAAYTTVPPSSVSVGTIPALSLIHIYGSQLMFRNQQTLALLAELVLTGKYEDLTGCQMTTWESPMYWIDDFEAGGERVLFHTHMGRFYLVEPGDSTMKRRFGEILERAGA